MQKILIANRGEIAMRVIRTCKKMGIQTVAIYSEVDAQMPFVLAADEAFCIGPAPSNQSYLLGDKIIAIALQAKVDGIHPGYGFLSENASFAQAVQDAGLIFIGPSAKSIETMGSKIAAKQAAKNFNVPMVPGTDKPIADLNEANMIAENTGFPLLIKASAGGGGKGMRIVEKPDELEEQLQLAKSEAKNAFNDDSVFIEKYIAAPKHIEIQILGDQHGNYVHLFERECSIQRRHQKLVEEAPSSCLNENIRNKMGETAIKVAQSCNYYGTGTVEFLVDENLNFYFLEMNTRLQVEHCVTEMICGLDLVEEQIKVARGEKLSFTQKDLKINGHAIELRICAEDPLNNFLPDMGRLKSYRRPVGDGIRVDDAYEEGMDIPIYYDPMIGKLIVWAEDRISAIDKMKKVIDDFVIVGIHNTLQFGKWTMDVEAFRKGNFDTQFIPKYYEAEKMNQINDEELQMAALAALKFFKIHKEVPRAINNNQKNWKQKRSKL